jgi:diguanylate cyclase (GGDEF)-like protein
MHAGLLELASIVVTADQSQLLDAIARTVSEALGWETVVLNVYRPAWDDYEVQTVHGSAAAREALLGEATPWSTWAPLIADRFEHRGAYLVRHGDFDWEKDRVVSYQPEPGDRVDAETWHPDEALFVVLRARDGSVSGVLSVDEPVSGRLPSDDEIDALVAIAAHAEAALRHAGETADVKRLRAALEHFHEIFSQDRQSAPAQEMLDAVARGMCETLGFERVEVDMFEQDGRGTPVARLLAAPYEREGCYLLTAATAAELAPEADLGPPSQRSGRGPRAWRDHRLLVPLFATTGELLAVIRVGEPVDRLLPSAEIIQALRVIGDQAASHLESINRLRELRYLANHDFLTGLGNRRAFTNLLEAETARAARYKSRFTLALCDIDSFKEVNDRYGHPAGDEVLRRTARIMESSLRRSDGAFRIGGDEFAIILVEATAEATREVTDRIEVALSTPERDGDPAIRVSFGAISSNGEEDAEHLLRRADEAMYTVKRARREA